MGGRGSGRGGTGDAGGWGTKLNLIVTNKTGK